MGNRMLRLAGAAVVAAVLLSGCVGADPVMTPASSPAIAPVFASDEEALAAAVEAYEAYAAMANEVRQSGEGIERIRSLVTAEQYEKESNGYAESRASGRSYSGIISYSNYRLQHYWEEPPGFAWVMLYTCFDVSATRVFDEHGTDITPVDRTERGTALITVVGKKPLQVGEIEAWDGSGVC